MAQEVISWEGYTALKGKCPSKKDDKTCDGVIRLDVEGGKATVTCTECKWTADVRKIDP